MTHPNYNLHDKVMCCGRKGTVVRTNALGLKKSNCIVLQFDDDSTHKLVVGDECDTLELCHHNHHDNHDNHNDHDNHDNHDNHNDHDNHDNHDDH